MKLHVDVLCGVQYRWDDDSDGIYYIVHENVQMKLYKALLEDYICCSVLVNSPFVILPDCFFFLLLCNL